MPLYDCSACECPAFLFHFNVSTCRLSTKIPTLASYQYCGFYGYLLWLGDLTQIFLASREFVSVPRLSTYIQDLDSFRMAATGTGS